MKWYNVEIPYNTQETIKRADNFKFALGMGTNWADLDKGYMYMIQEYAEKINDPKIPNDQKPTKIRITITQQTISLMIKLLLFLFITVILSDYYRLPHKLLT